MHQHKVQEARGTWRAEEQACSSRPWQHGRAVPLQVLGANMSCAGRATGQRVSYLGQSTSMRAPFSSHCRRSHELSCECRGGGMPAENQVRRAHNPRCVAVWVCGGRGEGETCLDFQPNCTAAPGTARRWGLGAAGVRGWAAALLDPVPLSPGVCSRRLHGCTPRGQGALIAGYNGSLGLALS